MLGFALEVFILTCASKGSGMCFCAQIPTWNQTASIHCATFERSSEPTAKCTGAYKTSLPRVVLGSWLPIPLPLSRHLLALPPRYPLARQSPAGGARRRVGSWREVKSSPMKGNCGFPFGFPSTPRQSCEGHPQEMTEIPMSCAIRTIPTEQSALSCPLKAFDK